MSAIRNARSRRSISRSAQSPYARPPAKKSSWSLGGLLSFLNPLRLRSPAESSESLSSLDEDESFESQAPSVAVSLSARADQISNSINRDKLTMLASSSSYQPSQTQPPQPLDIALPKTPSRPRHLPESSSPAKNLEAVSHFLAERAGQTISDVEVEGLISLIHKSTPEERLEPFRFSSSTPSTPGRGNSPLFANSSNINFHLTTPGAQTTTPSPRKTLSKNPNGVYRWEGGGSSKLPRSRNRYSSPAFGPSRSTSDRIVLKESRLVSEVPKDTKRRRVGDEALTSSASPSGPAVNGVTGASSNLPVRSPAPDPSPTRVAQALPFPVSNGVSTPIKPKVNGLSSTSRLLPVAPPTKPTVPIVPSPLRQAWSGGSSSSQGDSPPSQIPRQQKQTKAANFMAELIKEVTPPKRPDLSNPYQTASPVGKVGLPKVGVAKRVRATGRPAAPGKNEDKTKEKVEKDKECSPQAIIEATLPKGSKRSRPPAHFEKPTSSEPKSSKFSVVEQISSKKRSKSPIPESHQDTLSYVVEEVEEEGKKRAHKKSKPRLDGRGIASTGGRKSVTPEILIEEVKDFDMQSTMEKPTGVSLPSVTVGVAPSTSTSQDSTSPTTVSRHPFIPFASAPKEPSKLRFSYQPEAGSSSSPPTPPLPNVSSSEKATLSPASTLIPETMDKEEMIPEMDKKLITPKDAALAVPIGSLPTFVFTVKTFTYPMAKQHIKAREEARSLPKISLPTFDLIKSSTGPVHPPVKAFDWAAAGIKPTSVGTNSNWSCSECMLSNPTTAVECNICGAPRP